MGVGSGGVRTWALRAVHAAITKKRMSFRTFDAGRGLTLAAPIDNPLS